MGVLVEDIRISNQFTGLTTNYLLGNVGDKITIEVDFRAEEVFVTSAEDEVDKIILAPAPSLVNQPNSKDIVFCEQDGEFENYRQGDTIAIFNSVSLSTFDFEIYEKVDNQALRVHTVGGSPGDTDFYAGNGNQYGTFFPIDSYIYLTTELTSVKYRWNFIENNVEDDYLNKIDGQLNQTRAGGLTVGGGSASMVFDSPVTNNYGTATVEKITGTTTGQRFTLTHETIITPFFLAGQQFDMLDNIAPSYYASAECLKYITSIDVGRNDNDPNFIQTVDFTALDGNTGWFYENFNGGNSNYSIESIAYQNLLAESITSVELTDNTQSIEIKVKDNKLTPNFLSGSTNFTLNFAIQPTDQAAYTFNGKTVIENFYFDYAFNVADGATPVNGDNTGGDYQVLTNVVGTVDSTSEMTITANIDFTTLGVEDLSSKGFQYFIWVSTQDHTKNTEESDRVPLIADIKPFYIDLSDDGMVFIDDPIFLRHYETDPLTEGTTTPTTRTEDDNLPFFNFGIDRTDRTDDDISINYVKPSIIVKKLDGSEFTLEQFTQSFSGTQVINDSQFIDVEIPRAFQMPDNDQRKTIKVKRDINLDTTDLRFYEMYYPFLTRWEYWVALNGVTDDAFDTNEPNNGQNEDWVRYDTLTDWDIYFRVEVSANKNDNAQLYRKDVILPSFDYNEDAEWTNETIETFNADDDTTLNGLIVNPTKVVASKDYAGTTPPALADVEWVVRIEAYQEGGIEGIRFLSSVYDWTQYSWLKSVDASNKVVKSIDGSTYKATFLIDHDKLPEGSTFKLSARIYNEEALSPETCYLMTENENPIITEDSDNLVPQDCGDVIPTLGKLMEDGTPKLLEDNTNKIEE